MSDLHDDSILVEKLQRDDVEAFNLIYSRYSVNLYKFSLKYLRSEEEAREMVQSVFMKIWEIRKSINPDTSFKSFLFTIAYNRMFSLFRKRKYNQQFIKECICNKDFFSTETEEQINSRSLFSHIEIIISRLLEKRKTIFIKSHFEGKSTKEIAEECCLSPGTIDNYNCASLKYIRSRLVKESH